MQVAIDGPASAGKSTVAKIVAQKLSFIYIDTGAMYRACTVIARNKGLNYSNSAGILKEIEKNPISFTAIDDQQKIYIGDEDISEAIRVPEISQNVSQVAALAAIREKMVSLQREMAGHYDVVMDGRDIGTTVLPHAEVKIFLSASASSRAKRRFLDLKERGISSTKTVSEIEEDIKIRDRKDSHRKISPLKKAKEAIEIDTTNLTIAEVTAKILGQIKKTEKKL